MATNSCAICGTWFEAKTARKKTCSNACRMQLSRQGGEANVRDESDQTAVLLSAVGSASPEEIERLKKAVFPLEIDDLALAPLALRKKYGPTANLGAVFKLRNLPPHADLLEYLDR